MNLLPKVTIDLAAKDGMVDKLADAIVSNARIGEVGDGKIFVLSVEAEMTIRTGERLKSGAA